jgi:photosystem II stability/assembly factor-like uncharacterized protein
VKNPPLCCIFVERKQGVKMKNFKLTFTFLVILLSGINIDSQWIQVNTGFPQFHTAVHFIDSSNGIACGSNGMIIKSVNGGLNWTLCNSGTTQYLNDIKFVNNQIVIATGNNQIILRSTDSGNNWVTVQGPGARDYHIKFLRVVNSTDAVAVSSDYISPYYYSFVYKTSNAGESWNALQVYSSSGYMHFSDLNNGWANTAVSTGPPFYQYYIRVYRTTNGGNAFSSVYESSGNNVNEGIIYFYNPSLGFRVTGFGTTYLYKSISGGTSWSSVFTLSSGREIFNFYFVNSNTGWFVGNNSMIYKTTNSGANWNQQIPLVSGSFYSVNFLDTNIGWVAAGNSLLKTTNGGVPLGIHPVSTEIPNKFSLSQNYPNPFNPNTKIQFSLLTSSFVTLIVYDALGRELESLVNEQLIAGTYKAEWSADKFSSGVYYYKLTAGDFNETKKMIYVK